jgi:hypothetical protein
MSEYLAIKTQSSDVLFLWNLSFEENCRTKHEESGNMVLRRWLKKPMD